MADSVTARCLELYRRGQSARAGDLARAALADDPEDGTLWQLDGLVRRDGGDFAGALASLETASLLVPLSPAARCGLAECYARLGRPELAGGLYRHLATDPTTPTGLLPAVASGLGSIRDDEAALAVCRTLSRREPGHHQALFATAFYMKRLGYPAEVIVPVVAAAHELAPAFAPYRVLLASLLAALGRADEAYDVSREVSPDSTRCACCLAKMMTIFRAAGDDARADACRERARRTPERGAE